MKKNRCVFRSLYFKTNNFRVWNLLFLMCSMYSVSCCVLACAKSVTSSGQCIPVLSQHLQVRGCFNITFIIRKQFFFQSSISTWDNKAIKFHSLPHCWCTDINLHSKETTLQLLLGNGSQVARCNTVAFFSIVPHGHSHLAVFYSIHVLKVDISVYLFLSGLKTPPENIVSLNSSLSEATSPGKEHPSAAQEDQNEKCRAGIVY